MAFVVHIREVKGNEQHAEFKIQAFRIELRAQFYNSYRCRTISKCIEISTVTTFLGINHK